MTFLTRVSPNYFDKYKTQHIMRDLTGGLLVVFIASVIWSGIHAGAAVALHGVLLLLAAVATALVVESVWALAFKQNVATYLRQSFGWVTAIILVLMVQINLSVYAIVIATALSILVGKLFFGGFGQNIFNPAALGRGIIAAAFGGSVVSDIVTSATPATTMNSLHWVFASSSQLNNFAANFNGLGGLIFQFRAGAIGEASSIIIILVGIAFIIRNVIDWRIPAFYIGTVFVITLGIALTRGMDLTYPLYHIFSGGLLFGAVFMATDPVTSPTSAAGRVIFAIGCAILTVVIRLFGSFPEGVYFSILIMNGLTPLIESLCDGYTIKLHLRYLITVVALIVVASVGLSFASTTIEATADTAAQQPSDTTPVVPKTPTLVVDSASTAGTKLVSQSVAGNIGTYVINTDGFGVLEGGDANVVTVTIDLTTQKVQSVVVTKFNDTVGHGDKILGADFLNQFNGVDSSSNIDLVSTATISSKSVVNAIKLAIGLASQGGQG